MSIYSKIIDLFRNTKKEKASIQKAEDRNSITFSIDGFGRPLITIALSNIDSASCQDFAKMLVLINNGDYEQNILDLMVSLSKDRPHLSPAIETILVSWGMLLASSEDDTKKKSTKNTNNRPFIRPRNVFLGSDK